MATKAELANEINGLKQVISINMSFDAREMELSDLAEILQERIQAGIDALDTEMSELDDRQTALREARRSAEDLSYAISETEE